MFRPEFINRVDDIVVFQKLAGKSLTRIAELLVDDLRQRLIANGMNIVVTDAALDKIVREGTDLTNGARPLRRAIQRLIEDPLSEELLAGEWSAGDTVQCDLADGELVFTHVANEIPLLARPVSSVRVLTPRRRAAPRALRAPQAPPVDLSNRAPARTKIPTTRCRSHCGGSTRSFTGGQLG